MKNNCIRIILILCILTFEVSSIIQSQEIPKTEKQSIYGIRKINLVLGWYNPSMDYWNDYFKDKQWANRFNGSLYYGGGFELNIIKYLSIRTGISLWKETAESGDILTNEIQENEQLTISLTSISLDAIYNLWFLSFEQFNPYVGIGSNFMFTQEELALKSLPDESIKKQGQDFTGSFIVGIERSIFDHFSVEIEFQSNFGKYIQKVEDESGNIIDKNVSLSGPKMGIILSYVF